MSKSHDHNDHGHEPEALKPVSPAPSDDASSQALSEALKSSFWVVKLIMFVLVVVFLCSGVFMVPPNQKVVVLRFGKPMSTTKEQLLGPGLHWSWPYPIDEKVTIPISEIQNVTSSVGWYVVNPDGSENPPGPSLNPAFEGYAMTADGNIIHARITLNYRITDPISYVLNFRDAKSLVTNALDNALLDAASQFKVDDAIRLERGAFKDKVVQIFNRAVAQQQMGIVVESSNLDAIAPRQVKDAFDAVIAVEQESSTTNNAARSAATTLLTAALSESNSIVTIARSDSSKHLGKITADAKDFLGRLDAYERNPNLFRQLILADTWRGILVNADDKFLNLINDPASGKPYELRLLLNREAESNEDKERRQKQKTGQPAAIIPK